MECFWRLYVKTESGQNCKYVHMDSRDIHKQGAALGTPGSQLGVSLSIMLSGPSWGSALPGLHAQALAAHLLGRGLHGAGDMPWQGQDLLVDGVQDPFRLREEGIFQLVGRGDPVA